jgi:tripartite-type tricarboxylate transporter receptor subunit TctC
MHRRALLLSLAGVAAAGRAAFAWPEQPIRMIVPFTPAGGPDFIARYVADRLSPGLGQPVVVENMPGASGNIGSLVVARARPDGTTLMSSVNTLVMNASLYDNLPYDPVADFAPISLAAWGTLVLVAAANQEVATYGDMMAAAKAAPKKLTYGSPGVGTPHHLAMALVETTANVELLHVPYKGSAGAVQDIASGHIGYMFLPVQVAAGHIAAGKLKPLAVGGAHRAPSLPDVPTLAECGLSDVDVDMWYGFFAPKGTPPDILAQLNGGIVAILDSPDAKAAFEAQGLAPATSTSEAFADIVGRDRVRWSQVIAKRGIKAE